MGLFHCPIGALFYEDSACINCRLCLAKTKEDAVEASKKIREYLKEHASLRQKKYLIQKISVCGKGGVGKTTIVSLLAKTLIEFGYRILVIDTDESNPGLYRQLGFNSQPHPLLTLLGEASSGEAEPNTEWLTKNEIGIQDIPREFMLQNDSLRFMMVGKIEDPFQGCACSMAAVIRDLTLKLSLQDKEIVIIDNEAGVESFGRGVEQGVDTVLTVVEPSYDSLNLAATIKYMAEGIGIRRIRAIFNKIPSERIEEKVISALISKEVKYLGSVYIDSDVSAASFEGKSVDESQAVQEVKTIARLMLDEAEMTYKK